jgi:hypothetical protein
MADIAELEGLVGRSGRIHTFLVSRRKDYKPKPAEAPVGKARAKQAGKAAAKAKSPSDAGVDAPSQEPSGDPS